MPKCKSCGEKINDGTFCAFCQSTMSDHSRKYWDEQLEAIKQKNPPEDST